MSRFALARGLLTPAAMTDRILCVEDDSDACALLEANLTRLGYAVDTCASAGDALDLVKQRRYSTVLTDLELGDMSGFELCEQLVALAPHVPVIVVTGAETLEAVVSAMRVGAFDYLRKPVASNLLALTVARAVQRARLLAEFSRLRDAAEQQVADPTTLLGTSPAMQKVRDMIQRVAATDASVLILGETGTGKELVARTIHRESGRANGPFVAINCAAVPETLLESELFGHAKGAFTDAKTARDGLFVKASGGTLFLDEIGEMPIAMQAKLLRALQERVVRPVGGGTEQPFDARIVAATHRNLEQDIQQHRFRQDLYYRLNVVSVEVPPLRERTSDVLALATEFLRRSAVRSDRPMVRLSREVAERLLAYDWPGNVRELENCMERVSALAMFDEASLADLPEQVRGTSGAQPVGTLQALDDVVTIEELERGHIVRVLKLTKGNKSRAAELLGLDRRTLYRRLEADPALAAAAYPESVRAPKPAAVAEEPVQLTA